MRAFRVGLVGLLVAVMAPAVVLAVQETSTEGNPVVLDITRSGDWVSDGVTVSEGTYAIRYEVACQGGATIEIYNDATKTIDQLFSGSMKFSAEATRAALDAQQRWVFIVNTFAQRDDCAWALMVSRR